MPVLCINATRLRSAGRRELDSVTLRYACRVSAVFRPLGLLTPSSSVCVCVYFVCVWGFSHADRREAPPPREVLLLRRKSRQASIADALSLGCPFSLLRAT